MCCGTVALRGVINAIDYTIQDSWLEIWRGGGEEPLMDRKVLEILFCSPLLPYALSLFVLKPIAKELCISLQDLLSESFRAPSRKGIA
jgi:hypothetical protein